MKLSFLDSGIDSLKKGFEHLTAYEKLQFSTDLVRKKKQRYYHLKDAVLFIQHGVEILFKQILMKHSEYLLFTHIDDHVKKAFREKNEQNLRSVFETEAKHKIHTVSFKESMDRLKMLPKVKFGKQLEDKVKALEVYRNIIMHAEPYLEETEINQTFDGLANLLDIFFSQNLGRAYKTISGYSDFLQSVISFQSALMKNNQHLKAQTLKVFIEALHAAELSIGTRELVRFTDVDCCARFFEVLFRSPLTFGHDLYNGYCAGKTSIHRESKNLFRLDAEDKMYRCEFKLKSMLLYLPEVTDQSSPIIFIESDSFLESNPRLKNHIQSDYYGIQHVEYDRLADGTLILGKEEMVEYYESDHDEHPQSFIRFYSAGMMCFINVQGLQYNRNLKRLIEANRFMDGKDFEVGLRDVLKHPIPEGSSRSW